MFEDYYMPGIGFIDEEVLALNEDAVRRPAVRPSTVEVETVSGIGSPAATTATTAPAATTTTTTPAATTTTTTPAATTTATTTNPAAATGSGTQVVNVNDYSPSDADLQTMNMTRAQWNETMAQLSTLNLSNLDFSGLGSTSGIRNPDYTSNFRTFTAPLSNKGNATSTVANKDNTFNLIENQPIRLVDMSTGRVVFQGTGYEAAERAIALATDLTRTGGNRADWEIQTGQFRNPGSGDLVFGDTYSTVANEKRNTSILNQVLDVVGDAALGFIIGGPVGAAIAAGASVAGVNVSDVAYPIIATMALGPLGIPATAAATVGAAALGTAVSSAVQGRSVEETLVRSAITAATAGFLRGTDVGGRISDAIGGTMADLGLSPQLDNIVNTVSGIGSEAATREIIVNATSEAAAAALASGATGSAVSEAITNTVRQFSPDYVPSEDTTALLNEADAAATSTDSIVVRANPVTNAVAGVNPIVGTETTTTTPSPPPAETTTTEEEPPAATVTGNPATPGAGIGGLAPVGTSTPATTNTAPRPAETTTTEEEPPAATVTGNPATPGAGIGGLAPVGVGDPTSLLPDNFFDEPVAEKTTRDRLRDAADVINAAVTVGGAVAGSVGGGSGSGTGTTDTSGLDLTTGTLRPTIPGGTGGTGGIGGTGGNYPYTPQTYGRRGGDQETEYLFFTRDPITGQGSVQSGTPVTTTGTASADPAMVAPSANTLAEGGEVDDDMVKHLVEYHKNGGHQGPGQVKGIGSGQDDKIPAWLSDGEYVWSAQDVADLGDGSTDEGVRRLDKMRQMVRRQAGRKDVKKIAKPQKGIDRMLKAVGGLA